MFSRGFLCFARIMHYASKKVRDAYDFDRERLKQYEHAFFHHPGIRSFFHTHIQCDEVQDFSPLNVAFVDSLRLNSRDVPVEVVGVGDPAQSIYAFRGGTYPPMRDYILSQPDAVELPLTYNFRSPTRS